MDGECSDGWEEILFMHAHIDISTDRQTDRQKDRQTGR